jgi:hypothetical protein
VSLVAGSHYSLRSSRILGGREDGTSLDYRRSNHAQIDTPRALSYLAAAFIQQFSRMQMQGIVRVRDNQPDALVHNALQGFAQKGFSQSVRAESRVSSFAKIQSWPKCYVSIASLPRQLATCDFSPDFAVTNEGRWVYNSSSARWLPARCGV